MRQNATFHAFKTSGKWYARIAAGSILACSKFSMWRIDCRLIVVIGDDENEHGYPLLLALAGMSA